MAARPTARWGSAVAVAIAAHALFAAYALLTLKALGPPPEPRAVWLQLTRLAPPKPPARPPKPKPSPPRPGAAAPALHPSPLPGPTAPDLIQPPPAETAPAGIPPGLGQSLRRTLGCGSPSTYHLTAEERAHCDERLAQQGLAIPATGLNLPPAKAADYDRFARCRSAFVNEGVPEYRSATQGNALINGLGRTSVTDCPMDSHLP